MVGARNTLGRSLCALTAVGHGEGTARPGEHPQVVFRVAEGHHLLRRNAQPSAEDGQGRTLVRLGGGNLQIAGGGAGAGHRPGGGDGGEQLLPLLRLHMEDVELLRHVPGQSPLHVVGVGHMLEEDLGKGGRHHGGSLRLLHAAGAVHIAPAVLVYLEGDVPRPQQADDGPHLLLAHSLPVEALPGPHVSDGGPVGQHRVVHEAHLPGHILHQAPGPPAGNGDFNAPLRRSPQGGHVLRRYGGVVVVQQRSVHVQSNQLDTHIRFSRFQCLLSSTRR